MNLFSTLPIPDELQLRLSELVTASSANTYSYSSAFAPALVDPLSTGEWDIADLNLSIPDAALSVSRVGSGAGVPAAGDTVTISGAIQVTGADTSAGDGISIRLPFLVADNCFPFVHISGFPGADWTSYGYVENTDPAALHIQIFDGSLTDASFGFFLTYQTANAVD